MNSRKSVLTSLAHKEPKVPLFDLAFRRMRANEKPGYTCFFPGSGGRNLIDVLRVEDMRRQQALLTMTRFR